ncbi:hypothetical protein GFH48_34700 [Streptomyces fagopyri]|uniref:Uncharacterized protein n=1 Tax=Streptomyces fagopyri TaxID=2662397 RepID=A0A5Q0LL35_9ACTN|nr:hypothetical protein [Streptomyces fagopyri]QFZ77768.1 hypothetical protein GFH48_34700 [Streptomyces fagopyri]
MLRGQLPPLTTVVGQVVVCEVDMPAFPPHTHVYVAVVTRPEPHYAGARLAMIVTVNDPREAPPEMRENPLPDAVWLRDPPEPTVTNIYARPAFRMRDVPARRPAVQVGRQLRLEALLLRHSAFRSADGSGWAEAVGGTIPSLEEETAGSGFSSWAERELDRMERQSWWHHLKEQHLGPAV